MSARGYRKLVWALLVLCLVAAVWCVTEGTVAGAGFFVVLALICLRDAAAPRSGVPGKEGPLGRPLDPPE
jgi:hypothetical protein